MGSSTMLFGAAIALLLATHASGYTYLITELADPNDNENGRFVEIYSPDGAGQLIDPGLALGQEFYLARWTNGNADPTYSTARALSSSIMGADGFFIICRSSTDFATLYPLSSCDLAIGTGGPADSNGDDQIALLIAAAGGLTASFAIYDIFGIPGEDGTATTHEFEDGQATRKDPMTATPSSTWNANDWIVFSDANTPKNVADMNPRSFESVVTTPEPPPPTFYFIHQVQGIGNSSPVDGEFVTIEGIVVGDFQENLDGFFVQEEDADADGDPLTSEGIFVFRGGTDVTVGDKVSVTGFVDEFFGLTEIKGVTEVNIIASGQPLPAVIDVAIPVVDGDFFERVEGMLVRFSQDLVVTDLFNFGRFGEVVVASDRQMTPTALVEPGAAASALAEQNELARIIIDDGDSSQNPDPLFQPDGAEFRPGQLRTGDVLAEVEGVVSYGFNAYRIQPTSATIRQDSPRPLVPSIGGSFKVASFNVLNYFTTIDQGGATCGPFLLECRGADSAEELQRQRTKIIKAIAEMDADIVGLIELENNDAVALNDLVSSLNTYIGSNVYASLVTGVVGTDAIKVAFIYQFESVTPVGDFAILDSSVDPRFNDEKNRPALAQTFADATNLARRVTVINNHFKSKGSACDDVGDQDQGDGQGNCNGVRTDAALALVDWLATDPTASGDGDFLIIGDLNSYDKEDPIDILVNGGYSDLLAAFEGENAYTYSFDGAFGYLDYALSSPDLTSQVVHAAAWHINSDEPRILDYNIEFKSASQVEEWYEDNAFRSSDHDPVIVGLDLSFDISDILNFVYESLANGSLTLSEEKKAQKAFEKFIEELNKASEDEKEECEMKKKKMCDGTVKKALKYLDKLIEKYEGLEGENVEMLVSIVTEYYDDTCKNQRCP